MLWEAVLTAGLVSMIPGTALGTQQPGPLAAIGVGTYAELNGGEVWRRRVESIAVQRILAPPADVLSAMTRPRPIGVDAHQRRGAWRPG